MNEMQKIPDQKLKTGAIMAIVTSIIGIVYSIIAMILVMTVTSLFTLPDALDPVVTGIKVGIVIVGLIAIAINVAIIFVTKNVLQGKAKSGLVIGIITLVFGGLGLLGSFYKFNPLSVGNLIISGVEIAAGILLIIGKYLPENNNQNELLPQS